MPAKQRVYPLLAILGACIFVVRCVPGIFQFSPTIDEPYHIGAAVCLYESGKATVGAQHPPLARVVAGIPLRLMGVHWPNARDNLVVVEYPAFGIGQDILYSGQIPYQKMLVASRFAMLIFPLITFFYVYWLTRYFSNSREAMLATILLSIDPTVLGHAFWVGTDSAGCAGFVASLYYGIRWVARSDARRAVIFAVVWAIAIGCKYNCVTVGPIIAAILLYRIVRRGWRAMVPITELIIVLCMVFATLWIVFRLQYGPLGQQAMFTDQPVWMKISESWKSANVPMPSFWLGILFLINRASEGHATYLNGHIAFHGWLSYFPVALLVKSSMAFLIGLVIASIVTIRKRRLRMGILMSIALGFFVLSVFSKYQLGIRHLLPVIPLVCIVIAMTLRKATCVLILLGAVETGVVHPDYLAFFNLASCRGSNGEQYLIDSNLDWGQDTARLAEWIRQHAQGRPYSIRVFGASEPLIKSLGLDPASLKSPPERGLIAISANVKHRLHGATLNDDGSIKLGDDYSWVLKHPRVAKIGASIEVYDLEEVIGP
jgi:hypothetical protein